jgi:hypothetical protein
MWNSVRWAARKSQSRLQPGACGSMLMILPPFYSLAVPAGKRRRSRLAAMTGQVASAFSPRQSSCPPLPSNLTTYSQASEPNLREISSLLELFAVFRFLYLGPPVNLSSCAFRLASAHRWPSSRSQKSGPDFDKPRLTEYRPPFLCLTR